jgi:hypothetical protein
VEVVSIVLSGFASYNELYDGTYDLEDGFGILEIIGYKNLVEHRVEKKNRRKSNGRY